MVSGSRHTTQPDRKSAPQALLPYLLLTVSALLWSGNFVISKAVAASIPPVGLLFWRWMVALVILLPFALPRLSSQWSLVRANLKLFPLFGLLGVTLFNLLIYTAMHTTTAINAALVNSVIPVLIILFSRLFFKSGITRRQWFGVLLSLLGVFTIILRGHPTGILTLSFSSGDLLVLGAAVAWSLYSIALRYYPKGLDPLVFLLCITLCGLPLILPIYLWEIASGSLIPLTAASFATIAYVGICASVIAFICWNSGIRSVGAQSGGQFIHLMPVFSTILAVIFLHERLQGFHLFGIVLIVTGIVAATDLLRMGRP